MAFSPRARFRVWIAAVVYLAVVTLAYAALLSAGVSRPVVVGGWLVLGLGSLAVVALLATTPPDAIKLRRRNSELSVLALTVVALGAGLLVRSPGLSDDTRRYLFDADTVLSGRSPYVVTPAAAGRSDVPHGDLASIYPPVAQAVFVTARLISAEVIGLRVVTAGCALAGIVLLLRLLREADRPAWWAAPVALTPVWWMESAVSPHVDFAGVALLLGARLAARSGRHVLAGALLALSAGVKPQILLALPFLWRDTSWRALVGFTLLALPQAAAVMWQGGHVGFFRTLSAYSTAWEANGSIFELLKSLEPLGHDPRTINRLKDAGRLLGPVVTVITFYLLWKRGACAATAAYTLQLVMLLASPVVYPWYLVWVLAVAPLASAWPLAIYVWSVTVGLSYLLGHLRPDWTLPAWALLSQYLPVYLVCARDFARAWANSASCTPKAP